MILDDCDFISLPTCKTFTRIFSLRILLVTQQYLKRSLTSVLLDFVHISSVAWIMVMAMGILIYYTSGIILYVSHDKMDVAEFLVWTIVSGVILFLIIALILYTKMRSIVSKMLVMKLTIADETTGEEKSYRHFSALQTKMKSYDQIK
jgi:uncharacterized RDD family membrane protein YckC